MKRKIILRSEELCNRAVEVVMWMHREEGLHEMIIQPYKAKRTLEQNAYLHKLLADIANFTGDSLASTKSDMKQEFLEPLSRRQMKNGDWQVEYPSTADMNTKELSEFCEKIEAWAITELGFVRNG